MNKIEKIKLSENKKPLIEKALIFAAGLGTRFKPWTEKHPKALAIINGKSLLQRNIEYLQNYGIKDIVVNVHHFGEQIIESIKKNNGWGSNITISNEIDEVLETGGGMIKAAPFLNKSIFLTLNADILTDINLNNFLSFHLKSKSVVTLAVTNRLTTRYLLFNNSNRLCGWRNKITGEEKLALHDEVLNEKAYSGMAIFEPRIFEQNKLQGKFSLIDLYLSLATKNEIKGYDHSGSKFIDVGKVENIAIAESLFK